MNHDFSDEHEAFRKVVRDFAANEVAPHAEEWDREATFPLEVVLEMGRLGWFGLVFPEEYGGSAAAFTTLCIAVEELGRVDQSVGITLSAGVGLGANPIHAFGSPAQKERWLPALVAGRTLRAVGLTEPDGGSDAGATRTRARLEGGEWVIDGAKMFITNAGTEITACVTITARTGEDEVSTLIVPNGTEGYEIEPPLRKLGWK